MEDCFKTIQGSIRKYRTLSSLASDDQDMDEGIWNFWNTWPLLVVHYKKHHW